MAETKKKAAVKEEAPVEKPRVVEAMAPELPKHIGEKKVAEPEVIRLTVEERNRTIFFMLYLLLKSNMISRVNLKQMLNVINQDPPEDIPKWLVQEAAKA